jgi:uncharacterized protein
MKTKINLEDPSHFPSWAKRSAANLWAVLIAVHEASHAVVARRIGHGVEFMRAAIDDATGNGESFSRQPDNAPDIAAFAIVIAPDEGVDRLRRTYPGLAELTEAEAGKMSQPDREKLSQRVTEFAGLWYPDGSVHPIAKDARAEAVKILRDHWAEVEVIAARLLKNGKVTAAELNVRDFDLEVEIRDYELQQLRFYTPPTKPESKPKANAPKRDTASVKQRIPQLVRTESDGTERRFNTQSKPSIRVDSKGRKRLEGHAAVFNSLSEDLGGFREIIKPGAFRNALATPGLDVSARIQHQGGWTTVGRTTNGTLELREDDTGLFYSAIPPFTGPGRDIITLVKEGYIDKSSFAFTVRDGGESWRFEADPVIRELHDINLHDVAPVDGPAYLATSATVRSHGRELLRRAKDATLNRDELLAREIDAMLGGVNFENPPIDPTQAERDSLLASLNNNRDYKHVCEVRAQLRELGFKQDSDDLRIAELEALARVRGVWDSAKLRDFVSAHWHQLSENRLYA